MTQILGQSRRDALVFRDDLAEGCIEEALGHGGVIIRYKGGGAEVVGMVVEDAGGRIAVRVRMTPSATRRFENKSVFHSVAAAKGRCNYCVGPPLARVMERIFFPRRGTHFLLVLFFVRAKKKNRFCSRKRKKRNKDRLPTANAEAELARAMLSAGKLHHL